MESFSCDWKTDLPEIDQWAANARIAEVSTLAVSAGNRPIRMFAYGTKALQQTAANYNSACGAHSAAAYLDRSHKKPVILLVGAVHGQETEGTAALLNLISLLETGHELDGKANDALRSAAADVRLLLIPVMNPDGRARVQPQAMVGLTNDELRYWGQGTWKDGSLCCWPDCKKIHPILGHTDFLGGYFNDNGVNLMHDQFFHPMAEETAALMQLMEREQVDCVILLHGGTNSVNDLLQPSYVPVEINQKIQELAQRCDVQASAEGQHFFIRNLPDKEHGLTPPSFNLTSALHHVNGAISATFESNECIVDARGTKQTADEIMRGHMILFEQICRMLCEESMPE